MSLIHPAILWGLALVVVPVILHFLLRAKPKRLVFPALRLIQVRRKQNVRRMRLRHVWLMLLRIAVIALIVLAIARPSLPAADYSLRAGEWVAVAVIAGVVFGTYFGVMRSWRKRLPRPTLAYRRGMLRGGLGLLALVLMLLLVVWPYQRRISAALSSPAPPVAEDVPVAAVFLFDTSLSMQYRQEGKTRLEQAQEIAREHLSSFPSGSKVAIASVSSANPLLFLADLSGAKSRIDGLQVQAVSHSLNDRVRAALELQEEDRRRVLGAQASLPDDDRSDHFLREVYVFTDLAQSAWVRDPAHALREQLETLPWASIYLIDVGIADPTNLGITSLKLARQTVSTGGQLVVEAAVEATGRSETQQVLELFLQNENGNLVKQGQTAVPVNPQSAARARFVVNGLSGTYRQGEIRLASSDPLPGDDVRYFTVEVKPPQNVLVVSDRRSDAVYWMKALAPESLVSAGKARYQVQYLAPERLAGTDLSKFAAVCLINVADPPADLWTDLRAYVERGGGLAVILGSTQIKSFKYNIPEAQSFLPAELIAYAKFDPGEYFNLANPRHPLLRQFDELNGTAELTSVGVRRFWRVEPTAGGSVVAPYTDERTSPALLERPFGRGRTVVFTTAVDSLEWNDLPPSWAYLVLADQIVQYLSQQADGDFNVIAGENVLLRLPREPQVRSYFLQKPSFKQLPGKTTPGEDWLVIGDTDEIGQYGVVAAEPDVSFATGFSANPSPEESDLTRMEPAALDDLLGEKRYSIADSMEGLERTVRAGRIGQEMFSTVLLILVIVFCTEHLVANRFYETDERTA